MNSNNNNNNTAGASGKVSGKSGIGSNETKQLSVKGYLMNKYETYKDPITDNQFNSFMMENLTASNASNDLTQQGAAGSISNSKSNKRHLSDGGGGSTSSLQNSEDDDDEYDENLNHSTSREEKRRISHTAAEQKRRNAIKRGYQMLEKLLPSHQAQKDTDNIISTRTTRANVLEQTIDYIHELEMNSNKSEQDLDSLKKEIVALKILKSNYEEILKAHRNNNPKEDAVEINDDTKFEIFVKVADSLFQSYNTMTNANSFGELSSSMLNWVEQVCTSQNLKHTVMLALMQLQQMMN